MKRDMDLCRAILLKIESCDKPHGILEKINIDKYSQDEISYNIKLLNDAGLIEAKSVSSNTSYCWWPGTLTWYGHEFLSASRDESIWMKAKESVLKPSASITFDLLLEWLKAQAKQALGLP